MALWDEVKGNVTDLYSKAAEATEDLARLGARKYDRFGVSRDIERQFTELGSQVYKLLVEDGGGGDVAADSRVQQILARVQELEAELRAKDAEIDELRQRRRNPEPSPGAEEGPGAAGGGESAEHAGAATPSEAEAPDPDISSGAGGQGSATGTR